MITIKKAIKMQGTEFTYVYPDGDTIQAYIKKFDPKIGLSCWTFSLITDQGYKFKPKNKDEATEDAICVINFNLIKYPEKLEECLRTIEEINRTGKITRPAYKKYVYSVFRGCTL